MHHLGKNSGKLKWGLGGRKKVGLETELKLPWAAGEAGAV